MMKSAPSNFDKRESIRLKGKRRYHRGLFVLALDHMPAGAGVWPAFWMIDEAHWSDHGEIDIVENINNQTQAKTALHTGGQCRMYGQAPKHYFTGAWDQASEYKTHNR
jgi:beta-glucanase (GH16 family)